MTNTPSQHDEESTLVPSDYARLVPFAEELRRLAYDIDNVIRKRAPLPRCLSGIVAMRPLINLIEESTIRLLSGSDGDDDPEPEATTAQETAVGHDNDLIPGYL